MPNDVLGEFFEAGAGRSVAGRLSIDLGADSFVLVADGVEYTGLCQS